ncbi:MAG: ABC transporter substrate-binding protein [Ignavibacteriae bacterium]|nr:ABC transporter substrate-binding protein [Ignavibacteriota bacterium]
MKKIYFLFVILFPFIFCTCSNDPVQAPQSTTAAKIKIGVLLSLTGTGASSGESSNASLDIAVNAINAYLLNIGGNWSVQIFTEDTGTDTVIALNKIKSLFDRGIRFVIGPYSSAEVFALKRFADSAGVLLVSPSSVAISLAISGDNIFRYVTNDRSQAKAINEYLKSDTVKVIIPVLRNDVWGNDLVNSVSQEFTQSGGTVITPVRYDPKTTDFTSYINDLNSKVQSALLTYPPNQVAVLVAAFDEAKNILKLSSGYSSLSNVRWYGSSAIANNKAIIQDSAAAGFAANHGYFPCPIFGLDDYVRDKWEPLIQQIEARIGRVPDVYSVTAYDALWTAVFTYISTGTNPGIETLKTAFTGISDSYLGASGRTALNEYGDRAYGNYDFWGIKMTAGGYNWIKIAKFNTATGTLTKF